MAKFPGMVIPSKDGKNWTFTFREGVIADFKVVVAEVIDSTKIYPSAVHAKTAMREYCGLGSQFKGNSQNLPR